jgi:hypothetical protein
MLLVVIAALAAALIVQHRRHQIEMAELQAESWRYETDAALWRAEALEAGKRLEKGRATATSALATESAGGGKAEGK